jgi:hypothetical protein
MISLTESIPHRKHCDKRRRYEVLPHFQRILQAKNRGLHEHHKNHLCRNCIYTKLQEVKDFKGLLNVSHS